MKKKNIIMFILSFIVFLLASQPISAQKDTNYWHYHELIYKAECALYGSHNVDACFQYYDQAFNNFDFNYAHDLVNAAQLAHYYQRDYMKYLKKAVGFGVRPLHLKYIPAWKNAYQPVYKEFIDYFKSKEGQDARQQYLSSINQEYLAWAYQLKITEMKFRRGSKGIDYEHYRDKFSDWDIEFLEKVKMYGFPSAKLVGIDDSLLYKELQNEALNFNRFVRLHADSLCLPPKDKALPMITSKGDTIWTKTLNPSLDCPEISYGYLALSPPMLYIAHNPCPLKIFESTYDEIAKGNLHPREYAFMLDNAQVSDDPCDCSKYGNKFFRIGNFNQHFIFKKYFMPDNETDALRKRYWIIPLQVEQAKEKFGKDHGYRFNWGMNNLFQ